MVLFLSCNSPYLERPSLYCDGALDPGGFLGNERKLKTFFTTYEKHYPKFQDLAEMLVKFPSSWWVAVMWCHFILHRDMELFVWLVVESIYLTKAMASYASINVWSSLDTVAGTLLVSFLCDIRHEWYSHIRSFRWSSMKELKHAHFKS